MLVLQELVDGWVDQLEELKVITPPWSVSLPAQIVATYALHANDYYSLCYLETKDLRKKLIENGFEVRPVVTGNFTKQPVMKFLNAERLVNKDKN